MKKIGCIDDVSVEKVKVDQNDVILMRFEYEGIGLDQLAQQKEYLNGLFPNNKVVFVPRHYQPSVMTHTEAIACLAEVRKDLELLERSLMEAEDARGKKN